MIGLTLVTLVTMLATSIRASFFGAVDKIFIADYAVTAENNFDLIPAAIGQTLKQAPGVHDVVGVRVGDMRINGKRNTLSAVEPGRQQDLPARLDGRLPRDARHARAERRVHGQGLRQEARPVAGLEGPDPRAERPAADVPDRRHLRPPVRRVSLQRAARDLDPDLRQALHDAPGPVRVLQRERGASPEASARLDRDLKGFPNAKVQTREEFKKNQASFIGNILNILYVLLALSVIVSLFGIVNTLVLTIYERTRELGMLRAVGMTRWQVRWMVSLESVVTALIGAVVGIALGIVLSVLMIVRVDFLVLSWPVGSLIVFAIVAVIAGLVAAIFPARRAARLNVLEALQYE